MLFFKQCPVSYNTPYEKIGDEVRSLADEVPFDIPDSWEWVRLGNIGETNIGLTYKPIDVTSDGVPVLRSNNIQNGQIDYSELLYVSCAVPERAYAHKGDILICARNGSRALVGKSAIVDADGMAFGAFMAIYRSSCNPYIQLFINSYLFRGQLEGATTTTINQVTQEMLKRQLCPLPPIQEQLRIVQKYTELQPLIAACSNAYDKAQILSTAFPEALKKSILQEAVQGKLVPQDPSDEPAEALLKRIRAEKQRLIKEGKIKKDKHESVIFRRDNSHYEKLDGVERCIDEELPFEIPENWCWCRLKSIVNVVSARRVHQSDWRSEGVPFYRAREIGKLADTGSVDNELFITEAQYTEFSSSGVPHPGDLMATAVGTLGKTYIVKDGDRFYYKDASVICFENFGKINPAYLKLLMYSPYMEEQIKQNSAGTTVGTITIVKANEYLIPLPPLMEQQRIVDQTERLQIHIDKL